MGVLVLWSAINSLIHSCSACLCFFLYDIGIIIHMLSKLSMKSTVVAGKVPYGKATVNQSRIRWSGTILYQVLP